MSPTSVHMAAACFTRVHTIGAVAMLCRAVVLVAIAVAVLRRAVVLACAHRRQLGTSAFWLLADVLTAE